MAKKKHHEEHENLERWLVSYADFITLLFAFFTILYALSQTDKAKYKNAVESIQKAFLSAGGIFPLKGTPFTPFDKPPDNGSQVPPAAVDLGKQSKAEEEAKERIAEQIRGLFERTTGLSAQANVVNPATQPKRETLSTDLKSARQLAREIGKRFFETEEYDIPTFLRRQQD